MFEQAFERIMETFSLPQSAIVVEEGQSLNFTIDSRYRFSLDKRSDNSVLLTLHVELLPYMSEDFMRFIERSSFENANKVSYSVGFYNDTMLLNHVIDTEHELSSLDFIINDFIDMYESLRG